jgi:hypothetical protein
MCQKCQKLLHDTSVADGAPSHRDVRCGFFRFVRMSAVATSVALAACDNEGRRPEAHVPERNENHIPPEAPFVGVLVPEPPPRTAPPEDSGESTADYPTAEPTSDSNRRMMISPYTGKHVDVRNIPAGSLVIDPDFPPEARKYFRIPAKKQ